MIMLKDNHIWSAGSIKGAVARARSVGGFTLKIEVECRNIKEAEEAIEAGADVIMLDNFKPDDLKVAAQSLKSLAPHGIIFEASGGITLDNVKEYFSPHVDVLSMGNLTQGVPHVDISFKIVKK